MQASSTIDFFWSNLSELARSTISGYQKTCFKRKKSVDCFTMVLLIFRLVFSKNKQGYGTTILDFWEGAQDYIPRLRGIKPISASTFCDAREKLDENIFIDLNTQFVSENETRNEEKYRWIGHRLFCVDGTIVNLPRELLKSGYRVSNPSSHYPIGLVSCLYQLKSKLPFEFEFASHLSERACAHNHLKRLKQDDLVIYDRGYLSYALLEDHDRNSIHAVFRLSHTQTFKVIEEFSKSNVLDKVVEIFPTKKSADKVRRKYRNIDLRPIKLRLIKYSFRGKVYFLGTTLLDNRKYTISLLSELYHSRWGIEELYKTSKQVLNVEDFHGRTERKVKQEIYSHFLLITIGRIFTNEAELVMTALKEIDTTCSSIGHETITTPNGEGSKKKEKPPFRANFKASLAVIARYIEPLLSETRKRSRPLLIQRIIEAISRIKQRIRPGRKFKRESKKPVGKWLLQVSKRGVLKENAQVLSE